MHSVRIDAIPHYFVNLPTQDVVVRSFQQGQPGLLHVARTAPALCSGF
jgi:hypothetical protein